MSRLEQFISYLTGDFNNHIQIENEIKQGSQIHPSATHVNNVFNHRIENSPQGFQGIFILEESYYVKVDGTEIAAPHLFLFILNEEEKVQLVSYQFPKETDKSQIKNSNSSLKFEFNKLELSTNFGTMIYNYSEVNGFYGYSRNILPNGIVFTLTETIGKDCLEVMELMEKNGKVLTPYNTPIIYNRINW